MWFARDFEEAKMKDSRIFDWNGQPEFFFTFTYKNFQVAFNFVGDIGSIIYHMSFAYWNVKSMHHFLNRVSTHVIPKNCLYYFSVRASQHPEQEFHKISYLHQNSV